MARYNDFNRPQPATRAEKAGVAAEAMGGKAPRAVKPGPPAFHRMNIEAAHNGGVTVEHTRHIPVQKGKDGKSVNGFESDSMPGYTTTTTKSIHGPEHPVSKLAHSIHAHHMDSIGAVSNAGGDHDADDESGHGAHHAEPDGDEGVGTGYGSDD